MRKMKNGLAVLLALLLTLSILLGCADSQDSVGSKITTSTDNKLAENVYTDTWDTSSATYITLSDSSVDLSGSGASYEKNIITISSAGTYVVTGALSDGQLCVDAGDEDVVQLVLNGVDITCLYHAPICCNNANQFIITLVEGSENTITDGVSYTFSSTDEDEPDAAIFSHDDLVINGSGNLVVNANYQKGIRSKGTLNILGGKIDVIAVDDGISGKDGLFIANGDFMINAGEDALKSSNDKDADKGDLHITGGTFSINAGDDAIHAEKNLVIDAGTINIEHSKEALEGMTVTVNGGNISLVSSDDGINAAGTGLAEDDTTVSPDSKKKKQSKDRNIPPPDGDGMMPPNGKNMMSPDGDGMGGFDEATDYNFIHITGGNIIINASGDGIDSNGNLYVDGGTISIYGPTDDGNGPIDYSGDFEITGGTFIATGSAGMAQSTSESSTQASLLVYFDTNQKSDTLFELLDTSKTTLASVTPPKPYHCVLISTPDMVQGSTYIVKINSSELANITLEDIATIMKQDGTIMQE